MVNIQHIQLIKYRSLKFTKEEHSKHNFSSGSTAVLLYYRDLSVKKRAESITMAFNDICN